MQQRSQRLPIVGSRLLRFFPDSVGHLFDPHASSHHAKSAKRFSQCISQRPVNGFQFWKRWRRIHYHQPTKGSSDRISRLIIHFSKQADRQLIERRLEVTPLGGGHLFKQTSGPRSNAWIRFLGKKIQSLVKSRIFAAAKRSAVIQTKGDDRHDRSHRGSDRPTVLPEISPEPSLIRLTLIVSCLRSLVLDLGLCQWVRCRKGLCVQF